MILLFIFNKKIDIFYRFIKLKTYQFENIRIRIDMIKDKLESIYHYSFTIF